MNFITFGNETINLDTVTHIKLDKYERTDGTLNPFICFNFTDGNECITFYQLDLDGKPLPPYQEVKDWLQRFQADINAAQVIEAPEQDDYEPPDAGYTIAHQEYDPFRYE